MSYVVAPSASAQCDRSASATSAGSSSGKNSLPPGTSSTRPEPAIVSRSQYAHFTSNNGSSVPHMTKRRRCS